MCCDRMRQSTLFTPSRYVYKVVRQRSRCADGDPLSGAVEGLRSIAAVLDHSVQVPPAPPGQIQASQLSRTGTPAGSEQLWR